jgi:hypothetical protein
MKDNYLICSDLQIPYEAENALKFCKYVQKVFKISKENVLNVGDEIDSFHGGLWPKGADYLHTPREELMIAIEKLKQWYDAFPICRVAISNHGLRWLKKASNAEIPSMLIRDYKEIIKAPAGWHWRDTWEIKASKQNFILTHGMGYSGADAHRKMALDFGMSVAHGHLHSHAGVAHIKTDTQKLWGMNTGCLIDVEAYAFKYAKYSRFKACLGVGVVLDGGTTPIWIPYN